MTLLSMHRFLYTSWSGDELFDYHFKHQEKPGTSKAEVDHKISSLDQDEILDNMIGYSDFYVPVYNKLKVKKDEWHCHLMTFDLHLSPLHSDMSPWKALPQSDTFYVYVNMDNDQLLVYFETFERDENSDSKPNIRKSVTYYGAMAEGVSSECLEALKQKVYCVVRAGYDSTTCRMTLQVGLLHICTQIHLVLLIQLQLQFI